jgi:histidine triad (HIT) family protein
MSDDVSRRNFLAAAGSAALLLPLAAPKNTPAQKKIKDDCVFCGFAAGKGHFFKVWEDKNFLAFLDHKPINPGHTLLVPKWHVEYLFDLNENLSEKIFDRVRKLSAPLRSATAAKRIGLIVEGFGDPHAHIHLVPLHNGGELLKKGATGVTDEAFALTAEKIVDAIKQRN